MRSDTKILRVVTITLQVLGATPYVFHLKPKGGVEWHLNWCLIVWCAFVRSSAAMSQFLAMSNLLHSKLGSGEGLLFTYTIYFGCGCVVAIQLTYTASSRKILQLNKKIFDLKLRFTPNAKRTAFFTIEWRLIVVSICYCLFTTAIMITDTRTKLQYGNTVHGFLVLAELNSSLTQMVSTITFFQCCTGIRHCVGKSLEKLKPGNHFSKNGIIRNQWNVKLFGENIMSVSLKLYH